MNDFNSTTREVLLRAKRGDPAAWKEIASGLSRWLRDIREDRGRRSGSSPREEESILDAVVEVLRQSGPLPHPACFHAWVCLVLRLREARTRHGLAAAPPGIEHGPEQAEPSAAGSVSREDYLRLLARIGDLFPAHPEPMACVYLRYFERQSSLALATILETSIEAVRSMTRQGLSLLRPADIRKPDGT